MFTAPVQIRVGHVEDCSIIREIAVAAWKVAYRDILTPEFMAHEWEREYSDAAIQQQMETGHQFFILEDDGKVIGFCSYSRQKWVAKLHKLYLQPNMKGQGHGTALIAQVESSARAEGCEAVELSVNRFNSAIEFYKKQGYSIIRETDTEVGGGFLRSDYVMQKNLV